MMTKLKKSKAVKFGNVYFDKDDVEKVLNVRCKSYTEEELEEDNVNTELEDLLLNYGLVTQTKINNKKQVS